MVGRTAEPAAERSLPRFVEPFLEMLMVERGAAANTIEAYRRDLIDYCGFLKARNVSPDSADSDHIRAYLTALAKQGVKASTAARRLSSLRQFHKFLFAEAIRQDDPTVVIDAPRRGRPLPKIMTEEEVDRLLAVAEANVGPDGTRLQCLLELLYATGMRVSELVTLPLTAVLRDEPFLLIKGKGQGHLPVQVKFFRLVGGLATAVFTVPLPHMKSNAGGHVGRSGVLPMLPVRHQ